MQISLLAPDKALKFSDTRQRLDQIRFRPNRRGLFSGLAPAGLGATLTIKTREAVSTVSFSPFVEGFAKNAGFFCQRQDGLARLKAQYQRLFFSRT